MWFWPVYEMTELVLYSCFFYVQPRLNTTALERVGLTKTQLFR